MKLVKNSHDNAPRMAILNSMLKILLVAFTLLFSPQISHTDDTLHDVVKRIVVFPIDTNGNFISSANDAWWAARETLTKERRFLVASKRFMEQKDVYQPRRNLKASDAILLGRLLDAHSLIVIRLDKRKLIFKAISGRDGFLLWEQTLNLHPSVPISKQLKEATSQAIKTFVAAMPYQGSQVIDPLIGENVYEEGDVKLAKIEVSPESKVRPGDLVQWIQLHRLNPSALFKNGGQITVIAEGQVVSRDRGLLIVKVDRAKDIGQIIEKTAVRFPRENERLRSQLDESVKALSLDIVKSPMKESKTKSQETRPLVTAILGILNVAALILLAF